MPYLVKLFLLIAPRPSGCSGVEDFDEFLGGLGDFGDRGGVSPRRRRGPRDAGKKGVGHFFTHSVTEVLIGGRCQGRREKRGRKGVEKGSVLAY